MKKVLFPLILAATAISSFAQPYIITGSVSGSGNEEPPQGYNVILLHAGDSSFYKGDFFIDRDFSIESSELPIFVKVTSMGFADQLILAEESQLQLPVIRLEASATSLSEVVIKANIPLFSAKNDRLTMNVSGTVLSQSGTAADVLQKAARVKVDKDGAASVLGIGEALIVVDGRTLPSNQALEAIQSSDIQKIDIITNPSAKYDASGKAVIEIVTKKAKGNGWGGQITSRLGKGKDWREYLGIELSAKSGGLSLFASYAYAPEKRLWNEAYERLYPQSISIWNSIETRTKVRNNHSFRLSADYNLPAGHAVGAQLSGSIRSTGKDVFNVSKVSNNQATTDILSIQNGLLDRNYLSGTAFYSFNPASKKAKLDILLDMSNFGTNEKVKIEESNQMKQNDVGTDISINSAKADLQIFLPDEYRLGLGGKFSHIDNGSTTSFHANGKESRFADYNYKESIGAAYATLARQYQRFSFDGGLRIELSETFAEINDDVIRDNARRIDLFPNLSVGYKVSKLLDVSTSYAMKITRPTFQDMNPAINYIDSLSYFQGNPGLIPETSHSLSLKLTYKLYASLALNYTKKNDMLGWYIEQDKDNPSVTKATQKNIDRSDIYSIDMVLPYQTKTISCYLASGVIVTNSNDKTTGIINLSKPMWYAYSGIDLDLPYQIKLATNIRYFTKGVENIFYFDPVFRMDLNLQKSFLNDRLAATLGWNDVFRTDKMNTYTTLSGRYIRYNYYYDRSLIQLSVSYRLRSAKTKYKSISSIDAEESRIKGL